MWPFQHVFITLTMLSFHLCLMKPILSTKHFITIIFLKEGYSLYQIKSKTGLGKSTIGIIKKEVNGDKENSKGRCPSKLFSGDKSPIIHQTTNGRLDNVVEATHFNKNTFPDYVTPQTVRNAQLSWCYRGGCSVRKWFPFVLPSIWSSIWSDSIDFGLI